MSVLIVTSIGQFTIDLLTEEAPVASENFLKLCKLKYYNNVLMFNVQRDFIIQTGDPTGTGKGGTSVFGLIEGDQKRFFADEIHKDVKHDKAGTVGMASLGPDMNASQFYITTRDDIDFLNGRKTVFGEVAEGMDVVMKINDAFVDDGNRPYQDIRIRHTHVLFDPFEDPQGYPTPPPSPEGVRPQEETVEERIPAEEKIDIHDTRTDAEIEESIKENEAKSRAVVLEMLGDIPDADVKPPENVLFVCKLNPVTTDEDLELIFSRFGEIKSCEIIRDYKTGDSLQYAFIEFESEEQCNEAYFKMNNVLIDDRRIKVDFSQSVAKLWNRFKFRPWEQRSDEAPGGGRDKQPSSHTGRTASGPVSLRLKPSTRRSGYELLHSGGGGGGGLRRSSQGGTRGTEVRQRSRSGDAQRRRRSRSRSPRRRHRHREERRSSSKRRSRSRSRSPRRRRRFDH